MEDESYYIDSTYGSGTYVASESSVFANEWKFQAHAALDRTTTTIYASDTVYSESTGEYLGSTVTTTSDDVSYSGEYIQLTMPQSIVLTSFRILPRQDDSLYSLTRVPRTLAMLGSTDDGSTWELIYYGTDTSWTMSSYKVFAVTSSTYYSTFRMVAIRVGIYDSSSNQELFNIAEFDFYGYPPSPTTAPTAIPSVAPTASPSTAPTEAPTVAPSITSYRYPETGMTDETSVLAGT